MSFINEFWNFLKVRKKYWLLPIIIVLVLFGGLIVLTQGSVIAPFIYTIFQTTKLLGKFPNMSKLIVFLVDVIVITTSLKKNLK